MIGIIAAMQEEALYLKNHMTEQTVSEGAAHTFTIGKINGIEIVLVECGIGKVNAAIGTTLMIERFHPSCVINTGSAGGLNPLLNIGDVVISIEVRHHDVDLTVWGYEPGQLPRMPASFLANRALIEAAERAATKMNMHVTKGLIVSGDSFIHSDSHVARIQEKFQYAEAVEMEAAAIAQVCHQFQVPFVVIRALSDVAGKESVVSFNDFLHKAAQESAQLILHTLEELSNQ